MGDFTLGATGNASIGLTSVEFSTAPSVVNSTSSKGGPTSILYGGTTPTSVESGLLQTGTSPRPAMQDATGEQQQPQTTSGGASADESPVISQGSVDASKKVDHIPESALGNGLIDKLSEPPSMKAVGIGASFDTNTSALWSNATCGMEDATTYLQHGGMNGGGMPYQNYVSYNSGRRAITASHNFRQQTQQAQPQPLQYKQAASYGWATPGSQQQQGTWSSGASAPWNRGRSVPNLNPMQGGLVNRKPSPTGFNQPNMLISPVKFRRSTSYPGKGMFTAQPPTFEITNMDDARDLLPYQVRVCRVAQLACTLLTRALHVFIHANVVIYLVNMMWHFYFFAFRSMCLLY